jgi:hypothetical protein
MNGLDPTGVTMIIDGGSRLGDAAPFRNEAVAGV